MTDDILYHFVDALQGDVEIIDPKYYGAHYFTRNDVDAVKTPRTFFYLDPSQAERELRTMKNMYIVHLTNEQLKNMFDFRKPNAFAELQRRMLVNDEYKRSSISIDDAIRYLKNKLECFGVYYETAGIQMASLFYPVVGILSKNQKK